MREVERKDLKKKKRMVEGIDCHIRNPRKRFLMSELGDEKDCILKRDLKWGLADFGDLEGKWRKVDGFWRF